jgi:hypothetical protein
MCAARSLAVPAEVVDHVEPHDGDWSKFLTGALQSLCKRCHDKGKRFVDLNGFDRPAFGSDGWPVEPALDTSTKSAVKRVRAARGSGGVLPVIY